MIKKARVKRGETKMRKSPQFFGLVTVGERGQVVIPKNVRELLKIKSGEKLIVISGHQGKKMISLAPADEFTQFLSQFERQAPVSKSEMAKKGN